VFLGFDGGRAGFIAEQTQLAEVVPLLVVHEFPFAFLDGLGLAFLDQLEFVSGVSLVDDLLVVVECFLGEAISQLFLLFVGNLAQDRDAAEEFDQLLASADGTVLDLVGEAGSVQSPECAAHGGADVGRAGHVVHECQLAERLSFDLGPDLHFAAILDGFGAVQLALLDDVHLIAVITLFDYLFALGVGALLHGLHDGDLVLGVDGLEDEALLHEFHEGVLNRLRLLDCVGLGLD